MNRYLATAVTAVAAGLATVGAGASAQEATGSGAETVVAVQVQGGTARFEARTNISAISVHGTSSSLAGRAHVRVSGDAMTLERIEATLPVKTMSTGMGLRDEHMRKYIFTTDDGRAPDVKYTGEKTECSPVSGRAGESTCTMAGQLTIRGQERPFAITLRVRRAGDGYRAAGDGIVKLSTYGIERPSQLGVTTVDEVKLHLEFTAKAAGPMLARGEER